MSTVSLLSLPVELVHRIFDYLNDKTILRSLRFVCTQLYAITNTYNRYELNINAVSESYLRVMSHFIPPENVIALTVAVAASIKWISTDTDVFFSIFNFHRLTRLRSLTLGKMNKEKLEQLLQQINTCSLVSLSIDFCERDNNSTTILFSSFIARSHLRKLHLSNFYFIIKQISWPDQYALQHLTIEICTYHEYHFILYSLPHLRTFVMRNCVIKNIDQMNLPSSARTCYPQLTSLTINHCELHIEDLQLLLSLTPSLNHLRLVSTRPTFDFMFNGAFWEQFIRTKLLLLDKFEFSFTYSLRPNADTFDLNSIIAPFRVSFWLEDKTWCVICDYDPTSSEIILYTASIRNAGRRTLIRCEASSMGDICFVFDECINSMTGVAAEKLTTFHLQNKAVGISAAQHLAVALRNDTTLTTLHLEYNRVRAEGAQHLAHALRTNMTLTTLNLEYNEIGAEGVQHLVAALRNNETLITLSLQGNYIGDEGAQHIADTLRNNMTLTALNLRGNCIQEKGAQHLADALRNNKTLITLSLQANYIGDEGAQHIADVLRHNKTLTTLNLQRSDIGIKGAQHLADALRDNKTLTTLSLEHNEIGVGMERRISAFLDRNARRKRGK